MSEPKGDILRTIVYVLHCGMCSKSETIDNACDYRDAEIIASAFGWKRTSRHGWVCEICCQKLNKMQATAMDEL